MAFTDFETLQQKTRDQLQRTMVGGQSYSVGDRSVTRAPVGDQLALLHEAEWSEFEDGDGKYGGVLAQLGRPI